MNEYSCVIIDDEDIALDRLALMMESNFPSIHIIAKFNNAKDAINFCKTETPDIIFTDIKMPGINGLAFFEKIIELGCKAQVVLMSAYSQTDYLLKGIQLGLVGYLVKPYSKEELQDVVQKVIDKIELNERTHNLEKLLNQFNPKDKIPFKTMRDIVFESPENIVAIVAQKKMCLLHTTSKINIDINHLLKDLEEKLPYDFLKRVDKSHIVNLHFVTSIDVKNQICTLIIKNEKMFLLLSESGIKELKKYLN